MGFIQDWLSKRRAKERKLDQYQEDNRIVEIAETRKKSHEERELEKVLEKERKEAIKDALRWEEKRRQKEEILRGRQLMKSNMGMFRENVFSNEKASFLRGGMF